MEISGKFKLNRKEIIEVLELPETGTSTTEYRLFEDLDSEDKEWWREVKINNKRLRLETPDIIIKKR